MNFIFASTFEKALARLNPQEQKAVKNAAVDLLCNPIKPGFSLERVERARHSNYWSARVNDDIRIITHRSESRVVLCYAGHHEDAYRWAERRRYDVHPATGIAQFVEMVERVEEVVHRVYKTEYEDPPILRHLGKDYLFSIGIPLEWLEPLLMATENNILDILSHLPEEVQGPVLDLASGNPVRRSNHSGTALGADGVFDPFLHRKFRTIRSVSQLRESFEKPWSSGSLVPDREGLERGIRLFQFLLEAANRGRSLGISYVGFLEFIHRNRKFSELVGRRYLPSDSGVAVRIALSVTGESGGRRLIVRTDSSINAGMDTFIWSSKRPFDRPPAAWKNYPAQPPYSRGEWLAVFPSGARMLLRPSELLTI